MNIFKKTLSAIILCALSLLMASCGGEPGTGPSPISVRMEPTLEQRGLAGPAQFSEGLSYAYHVFSGLLICPKCGKPYMRKVAHGRAAWDCGTFVRKDKAHCHGKQIPEEALVTLAADVLDIAAFDETAFQERMDRIIVPAPNALIFVLSDGRTVERTWDDRSRSECWDAAARGRPSIHGKQRWPK